MAQNNEFLHSQCDKKPMHNNFLISLSLQICTSARLVTLKSELDKTKYVCTEKKKTYFL
jgi:hypothetical protein